jgi:hypothetical protein
MDLNNSSDTDFNRKRKPLTGTNNAVQGELVTPTPTNYTKPKVLPNETFVDGQVSRPSLAGTNPTISATNPVNPSATQSLPQMAQKPTLPPYQPATNPVNQYGAIPPQTGNVGSTASPTPPAQSITTRLAGTVSKVAAATPAIQSGMNASAIMNQEANFVKNIHSGSIADPNLGNELMGNKPQFSRTQTLLAKPTTGNAVVGRGGNPVVPEQFITSRAGRIENPAYTQYMANRPSTPVASTIPAQPLRNCSST